MVLGGSCGWCLGSVSCGREGEGNGVRGLGARGFRGGVGGLGGRGMG